MACEGCESCNALVARLRAERDAATRELARVPSKWWNESLSRAIEEITRLQAIADALNADLKRERERSAPDVGEDFRGFDVGELLEAATAFRIGAFTAWRSGIVWVVDRGLLALQRLEDGRHEMSRREAITFARELKEKEQSYASK